MRVFFILIFFIPILCCSQDVIYKRFTTNEGLPSTEVYAVAQSADGYIWVGTDNGLARYDGKRFVAFSSKDGLPDNTVVDFTFPDSNSLWPVTLSNNLSTFRNNKFREFDYTIDSELNSEEKVPLTKYLGKDSEGLSYIVSQSMLYKEKSLSSQVFKPVNTSHESPLTPYVYYKLKQLKNGKMAFVCCYEKEIPSSNYSIKKKSGFFEIHGPFSKLDKLNGAPYYTFFRLSSNILFGINYQNGHYLKLRSDFKGSIIEGNIPIPDLINFYEDQVGNKWFLTKNGGYCYFNGDLSSKPLHILENSFLTQMIQDLEGNYWFSDHSNGLVLVNSIHLLKLETNQEKENLKIAQINTNRDFMWYSTINGEVIRLDSELRGTTLYKEDRVPYDFYPFSVVNSSHLIIPGSKIVKDNKVIKTKNEVKIYGVTKDFEKWRGMVYVASSFGLIQLDSNSKRINDTYGFVPHDNDAFFTKRTNALLGDANNLWIGAMDGLYSMDTLGMQNKRVQYYGKDQPLLSHRIMVLEKLRNGVIIAGTKGEGLLIYDYHNNIVKKLSVKDGILSNFIKSLFVFQGKIYVGTNEGLSIVTLSSDYSIEEISNIDIYNGLPSNEIFSIAYFKEKIWLGSSVGLLYFDPNKLVSNKANPPIFLKSIETGDSFYAIAKGKEPIVVNGFRNIVISYNAIGYRAGDRMQYKYFLEGEEEDTIWTNNQEVRYTNIAPGNYTFYVWAQNEDGVWSENPDKVSFCIPKKYYESGWFVFLMILMVGFILYFIIKEYNKRKREKLQIELQQSELKQKALAALMNPHFVYNSLSAIQNFINKGDNLKSNDYLTRFSKLIRMNLNSVRDGKIALEDEIARLKLYLEIEQMRFGEKLSYKIEMDEELESMGIEIPSMILQPFVENAIWHGVLPKKENGLVEICLEYYGDSVLDVVIKDNGLGIDTVKKENKPHHTSLSMEITRERLELLSKHSGIDYTIEVSSILEQDGGGTKVHLRIPIE